MVSIPQQAIDFIVAEEAGSQAYYEKFACHPTWPGGASGMTIGVGFDLGQQTADSFRACWGSLLDGASLDRLTPGLGLKGSNPAQQASIQQMVKGLVDLVIPWDAAVNAFETVSLPRYTAMTVSTFPGCDKLDGLCLGALVSLVYNRGTRLTGDDRVEMQKIHDLIVAGTPDGVPDQFRAMKRLWPNSAGLQNRRDKEADLFQQGLNAMAAIPVA